MRRSAVRAAMVLGFLIAVLAFLGVADDVCPADALASDSDTIETDLGSFEVDVCVLHDAGNAQHVYEITVRNVDIGCPLQSFGIRPVAGVNAELENSSPWGAAKEEPDFWIWDGSPQAAIMSGESRRFVLRVPDSSSILPILGTIFPGPGSSCGDRSFQFGVLGATVGGNSDPEEQRIFSELCACSGDAETFSPAGSITVPGGYRAEYLVAPSGLNVPSDVAVADDGTIYVASSRAHAIFRVSLDGAIERFAASGAYAIDVDASGQLYGYNYPRGQVVAYGDNGESETLATLQETFCESMLAVAGNGTLYVAMNYCVGDEMGLGTLYRLRPPAYELEVIADGLEQVSSIDVAGDGAVYVVADGVLSAIDPEAREIYRLQDLGFVPSFHGLAASSDGSIFVSSGGMATEGAVYRFLLDDPEFIEIASIDGNGIQGIELLPDGSLVGVQRSAGGLQQIRLDGTVVAIVEPNGLVSPEAVAATPCGELVVVNDEAGWASIVCPNGTVKPFVRMISFIPPLTYLASSEEGWIVAGESAPGFPSQLIRYSPSGEREVLADDILDVSGVVVAPDGSIIASATREDRIYRLSPSGARAIVADDVRKPLALALSAGGQLFAIINRNTADDFEASFSGDAIVEILPDGSVDLIAEVEECYDLALDDDGTLYATAGETVWRIAKSGTLSVFASGFEGARGIAFAEGILYITDDVANAIVKVSKLDD